MVAVNYNFDIEQGSDFEINFVYNGTNGLPVDLSDKCVIFTLVPSVPTESSTSSDMKVKSYTNENNTETSSLIRDNSGAIKIFLSGKETNSFNFLSAVYDLDVRDSSGLSNTRLAAGSISIIARNSSIKINDAGNFECDSEDTNPNITPTPTDATDTDAQPTPTPTLNQTEIDFCLPYDCGPLDIFSTVYDGSGLILPDLSTVSGDVNVTNTGIISNVELAINKLSHNSPSDLVFLLAPPSGDKILLSANSKISNFNNNFSFMFSNKAASGAYLNNINNGEVCNILDKTSIINYNNEILNSSFDHLFGISLTGVWSLIVQDTDPLGSGSFDSWKLIITYESNIEI